MTTDNTIDQRYYASSYGRFNTADPQGSRAAKLGDPESWNQYAYTRGDPVNGNDAKGLCDVVVGGITETSTNNTDYEFANQIGAVQAMGMLELIMRLGWEQSS